VIGLADRVQPHAAVLISLASLAGLVARTLLMTARSEGG
jgi:hypothetical protein